MSRSRRSSSAAIAAPTYSDDLPPPGARKVQYSPYPEKNFPNRVYFGDTHLHTSYSTDAGMIGNTLGPEQAYRFARGETVTSSTGLPARLQRPLDFLVVIADHAENLGLAPAIAESNPALLQNPWGKEQHDLVKKGGVADVTRAYENWMEKMGARTDPLTDQPELATTMWAKLTAAAEQFNEPGRFTALIGFEWTSNPDGNNLHRNVVLRDGKDKADQVVPFSQYDSVDPEDLWTYMANYERLTGGKALAIAHNGNLSNGLMFDDVTLTTKQPLDRDYAERRMRWEPLQEVTQMKGDGETHPSLSPNDEFADFERWDKGSFGAQAKTPDMLPREYAREAFKRGLAYEARLGVNPFKFGMVGSTDAHTSLPTTQEDNFFGKVVLLEPSADPIRFEEVVAGRPAPKGTPELCPHHQRIWPGGGLGARQHAGSALGRHVAQGGLRHHRHASRRARVWWLRFFGAGPRALRLCRTWLPGRRADGGRLAARPGRQGSDVPRAHDARRRRRQPRSHPGATLAVEQVLDAARRGSRWSLKIRQIVCTW